MIKDKIYNTDCLEGLKKLPDNCVDCSISSPPYWGLRSYLPGLVELKKDTPKWVKKELEKLNIKEVVL